VRWAVSAKEGEANGHMLGMRLHVSMEQGTASRSSSSKARRHLRPDQRSSWLDVQGKLACTQRYEAGYLGIVFVAAAAAERAGSSSAWM
jgi:hypothetical protein